MAQRRIVLLEDDLDGGEAAETVTFGLDNVTYEIDLNEKNAAKLRKAFDAYVDAGRRTGGRRKTRAAVSAAPNGEVSPAVIRAWARENGHDVPAKGRIPAAAAKAYHDAH